MKELELTIRVRNNRLKERRDALGMSQAEFANAASVSLGAYSDLEALRLSPMTTGHAKKRHSPRWRPIVLALAKFHCVEPEELFPDAVLKVVNPVVIRKVDAIALRSLATEGDHLALPEERVASFEGKMATREALRSLSPREARVIELKYGFDGQPRTYEEVGEILGVTRERIRQIEARALRGLRHPSRSKKLRAHYV